MSLFVEIEPILEKVIKSIIADRTLLTGWKTSGTYNNCVTAENLEDAAANHFFDDYPETYGITEKEGHMLRAYFQKGCKDYDFVIEIHRKFHDLMDEERKEYLDRINRRRKYCGLGYIKN